MPKLPNLSKDDKPVGTKAVRPKTERTPAAGAGQTLAGLTGGPRGIWVITAIAAVITIVLVLVIGLVSQALGSRPAPNTPGSPSQSSVTADSLLADMQGGALTWNGTALTFGDPKVGIDEGVVYAQASYVDANVSMEQAVAVAKKAFSEPSITMLKFESFNPSGDRQVLIEFNSASTPVSALASLEGSSTEAAYKASANYSLSDDAYWTLDYDIPQSGGTSPRP